MAKFTLKEYLKNPNRKVITKGGLPVRIICTDVSTTECSVHCPIVALFQVQRERGLDEVPALFTATGKHYPTAKYPESMYDLVFAED